MDEDVDAQDREAKADGHDEEEDGDLAPPVAHAGVPGDPVEGAELGHQVGPVREEVAILFLILSAKEGQKLSKVVHKIFNLESHYLSLQSLAFLLIIESGLVPAGLFFLAAVVALISFSYTAQK